MTPPLPDEQFPRVLTLRQRFESAPPLDVQAALARAWNLPVPPGSRIAVAVGSRGIARLREVVSAVLEHLRGLGARPFIVPAMGSHGGATAEGQAALLASYGITEQSLGAPVAAAMDVELVGTSEEGVAVHLAAAALASDGIVVVNRIKPHTEFRGPVESGLMKMIAVGLGKQPGAAAFHAAAARLGFPRVVSAMAQAKLAAAPFLGGVALLENQRHELVRLSVVPAGEIETTEPLLLEEARRLMPRLPLDEIDLLVVDLVGKNISGTGMDPNIIGRDTFGYSSSLGRTPERRPLVHRIFVRELTPESHGNASGLGLADFTTARFVRGMDLAKTYMNSLTSLTVLSPKIPMHFETDREVIARALGTLALADPRAARVVRIRDTLSLETMQISEACRPHLEGRPELTLEGDAAPLRFDAGGNLLPLVYP